MAGAALALFVLIALPLAFLVGGGLTGDGGLRLVHFRDAVSSRLYVQALRNSFERPREALHSPDGDRLVSDAAVPDGDRVREPLQPPIRAARIRCYLSRDREQLDPRERHGHPRAPHRALRRLAPCLRPGAPGALGVGPALQL